MQAYSSPEAAFRASYPFDNPEINRIDGRNVRLAIHSTTILLLIDKDYVYSDNWRDIYFYFASNRRFFRIGNSEQIASILRFLRRYWDQSDHIEYPNFYAEYLTELVIYNIAGKEVTDGVLLSDYLYGELRAAYGDKQKFILR